MSRRRIVEITWDDCQFVIYGWMTREAAMTHRGRVRQRSAGYVLRDDRRGIVLASSLSADGDVAQIVIIPAAQIVRRRRLT